MISRPGLANILVLVALPLWAAPAGAQQQSVGSFRSAYHIVRPGDTLIGITRRYLGSDERWRENWRLNPDIEDPDYLVPGQRIQVFLPANLRIPTARVSQIAGRVENRPVPISWDAARLDDLLLPKDGQRTFRKSSSELQFPDGTSLVLTEESLVFLRRTGSRLTAEKRSIEIVEGQADLDARLPAAARSDIEVLVAGVKTVPLADESGVSQTRARKSGEGAAQVMVYEGSGEVEAAGRRVNMARGTGTTVPPGKPPPPPEQLLRAPTIREPAAGSRLSFNTPTFSWDEVEGAAAYRVEICLDLRCARLVERAEALAASRWRSEGLIAADLFWRVRGISAGGLDGYASEAVPFSILVASGDVTAPIGSIRLGGRLFRRGEILYTGRAVAVEVAIEDDQSGPGSWQPVINGRERDRKTLSDPWETGDYRVAGRVSDLAGNVAETDTVSFRVDADPPEIAWRVGPWPSPEHGSVIPARRRQDLLEAGERWIEWSVDWRTWSPLEWAGAEAFLPWPAPSGETRAVVQRGADPQLFLRAVGGPVFSERAGIRLAPGEALWLAASDAESGVASLDAKIVGEPTGGSILEVRAVDQVGNERNLRWPLVP